MRKKIAFSISLILSAFIATQATAASDDARYRTLGQCIAYTAVKSGLNGNNEISPFTAETLASLGEEFMFESSLLGISEEDSQYFVVGRLIEYNIQIEENNAAALIGEHEDVCRELIKSLN